VLCPTQEQLNLLCEQVGAENDPQKFLELVRELNDLLEAKRLRFSGTKADSQPSNYSG